MALNESFKHNKCPGRIIQATEWSWMNHSSKMNVPAESFKQLNGPEWTIQAKQVPRQNHSSKNYVWVFATNVARSICGMIRNTQLQPNSTNPTTRPLSTLVATGTCSIHKAQVKHVLSHIDINCTFSTTSSSFRKCPIFNYSAWMNHSSKTNAPAESFKQNKCPGRIIQATEWSWMNHSSKWANDPRRTSKRMLPVMVLYWAANRYTVLIRYCTVLLILRAKLHEELYRTYICWHTSLWTYYFASLNT
jgi:hypothetical protein